MNVKKQIKKISDYCETLRKENIRLNNLAGDYFTELNQYRIIAQKFINRDLPTDNARDKFIELLDGTTININLMAKYDGVMWRPIIDTDLKEEEHLYEIWYRTYRDENVKLREENAKLREQLQWHPVIELPKTQVERLWSVNVLLKNDYGEEPILAYYSIKSKCWYDYHKAERVEVNDKSTWCYIPGDDEQ